MATRCLTSVSGGLHSLAKSAQDPGEIFLYFQIFSRSEIFPLNPGCRGPGIRQSPSPGLASSGYSVSSFCTGVGGGGNRGYIPRVGSHDASDMKEIISDVSCIVGRRKGRVGSAGGDGGSLLPRPVCPPPAGGLHHWLGLDPAEHALPTPLA